MSYLKNVNLARKIILALIKKHKLLTMYYYYTVASVPVPRLNILLLEYRYQ